MKTCAPLLAGALLLTFAPTSARADTTADLAACVTRSVTPDDNIALTQWVFSTMSRHPALASMASVSDPQRVEANRKMGALVNRLLLTDCVAETRRASQEHGEEALRTAFTELGQKAMEQLMGQQDVSAGSMEFVGYLDQTRLREVFGPASK